MAGGHEDVLSLFVVLAAVAADIVWILTYPVLGVPCMLAALVAQVGVLLGKRGTKEGCGAYEWALSFWILGSALWMFSEYLWDSDLDVAAFTDRVTGSEFHSLDVAFKADVLWNKKLYPETLGMACLTLWITFVILVVFMTAEWVMRQRASASKDAGRADCEDLVCGMPMHIYEDLWFTPWLFMESCWVLNNLQMVLHLKVRPCFWFGVSGGLVAMVLCADCVRRYLERHQHHDAAVCAAHLAWVAGNLVWYVFDVERFDAMEVATAAPVALFVVSLVCLGLSTLLDECRAPGEVTNAPCKVPAEPSVSECQPLLANETP